MYLSAHHIGRRLSQNVDLAMPIFIINDQNMRFEPRKA
jgi:hypothetical protein